jgi:ComF family protein
MAIPISRARSAFAYSGWVADAVKRLKYKDEFDRANHMAAFMVPMIAEMGHFDALIPVPLHRSRMDERGYNQSELLARAVSRLTSIPVKPLLVRTSKTVPQVKLARNEREANMKHAFDVADGWIPTAGERYLLIDDVRTSGATLNECAQTLVLAGSGAVCTLTFAMDLQAMELHALRVQRP